MAKDPAFLFYSSDFLTGTIVFTTKERGQYITLLCVMHQGGRLTMEQIKAVLRGESVSPKVLAKFKLDDQGQYYNERLENETKKRKEYTNSRKNSLNINNGDAVHIYLLNDPDTGNYKIGSSKYPLMRLTEIQKKRAQVNLYWKSETLVERVNEKILHEKYKPKKVSHDWFNLDQTDLLYITSLFRTEVNNDNRTEARTENENEIDNENLGVIQEGGLEETINPDSVLEQMAKVFMENNPDYPFDRLADLPVLKTIGEKIVKWQKSGGAIVLDVNRKIIRDKWGKLVTHIRADSHLSKYSITQINKHFQSVVQSLNNGNTNGKAGQNYPHKPVITGEAEGAGSF